MPLRPQQYTVKLQEKQQLNARFAQYTFELLSPNVMEFAAGQYVSILVSEKGERRSYSLVSSPEITHGFELLVDHTPGGIGSQYFSQLTIGAEAKIIAPMGIFTLNFEEPEYVFIATGSGIAPFRSMILQLLQQQQSSKRITLYWGLRTAADMVWQAEFQELMSAFPHFKFHPTLSQSPAEWPLCRGRVTDCLAIHDIPPTAGYYLCGGAPMIVSVKELLQKRGIPVAQIHHEKFF